MVKVLNLLTSGGVGGIEILCKDIGQYSNHENGFCFMFDEGTIYDQMKQLNQKVYSLKNRKKISLFKFKKLLDIAKNYDIIAVHHDDPFLEIYFLLLMIFLKGKKYVSTVHHCYDPDWDKQNYNPIKFLVKTLIINQMFKKSDCIIFVSNAGYESFKNAFKINMHKIRIVYNGIGDEKLSLGLQIHKEEHEGIKLLFSGRLERLKGVHQLIEAFSVLYKKYPLTLKIVGDGRERKVLESQVEKCGLSNYVHFIGFTNNVIPYLAEADIFIYPSRTEIFGISIIEAMAFRNICVANNVGGIPEIIRDDFNGYLNFDNNLDGLLQKIEYAIKVYNNPIKKNQLCDNAQKTAIEFTIKRTIADLENIYLKLIDT